MSAEVDAPPDGTTERERELERRLDSGVDELPPNQPKGMLGERGVNLMKVDDFAPDLNAGVSQEVDLPVVWLGIVLALLLFFPLGYVLLWRSRLISRRSKVAVTVVSALLLAAVATWLVVG